VGLFRIGATLRRQTINTNRRKAAAEQGKYRRANGTAPAGWIAILRR
jgi:hypothetical protein